jgi:predicted ABC-type transport system involved in lysophospholipase L1 biosynthesis ATPase subunit
LITDLHQPGMTINMVTLDERVAVRCQRFVRLRDGEVESDVMNQEQRVEV